MVKPRARSWSLGRSRLGRQRRSFVFSKFFFMPWAGCSLCQGLESRGHLTSPFFFFVQGWSLSQGLERKKKILIFFTHTGGGGWHYCYRGLLPEVLVSLSTHISHCLHTMCVCVCVCVCVCARARACMHIYIHTYIYVGWLPLYRYWIYSIDSM